MDKTGLMNELNFSNLLNELEDAFNYKLAEKSSTAYWKWLKNIPGYKLEKEVKKIILNDHRFPSIARLAEAHKIDQVAF